MVRELPVGDAKKFRSKGRLEHDFLISFTIVSNEYSFISGQNSNVSNTRLIIKNTAVNADSLRYRSDMLFLWS